MCGNMSLTYIKYAHLATSPLVYVNELIHINKTDREPENSAYGGKVNGLEIKAKLKLKNKNNKYVPTWGKIKAL